MQIACLSLRATVLLLSLLSLSVAAQAAPTSQPSSTVAREQAHADAEPLQRAGGDSTDATPTSDPTKLNLETSRVVGALAIVIGLIFLLRWGGRRFFNVPGATRPNGTVRVLSRSLLAPKQQVILLQVGKRVIVVGDSGAHMSPLCEITDPDEVAALVGQIHEEKIASSARPFGAVFGRVRGEEVEVPADLPAVADSTNAEITHVEKEGTALSETREELNGLMEKIRMVSRQLRNG